jgi:predicted alpha/beta superfamily hydrolase
MNVRYPVLYLNDGQNLFDPSRAFAGVTWSVAETATALVERGVISSLVIVGIDHGELQRAREYLPVNDARNPLARGPLAKKYAEFLVRELMPFIEQRFPVAHGPSQTGFGGSSYGAVAALYAAMRMPGTFGRLLLESPSLYVGNGYLLKQARLVPRWPQRVYLGVGTEETRRKDWNEETVANVVRLAGTLRDAGLGPRRLRVIVEPGATHSEGAWAGRLPQALEFLYRRP